MPYVEGQLTFIDFLGYKAAMAMAKKRLFGGPYLTFNAHCAVLASVYESAAVVGRAKSDKLSIIEKIIAAQYPEYGPEPIKDHQIRAAKESLDEFKKERGREPHSFLEFVQVKQLENAIPDEKLKGLFSGLYEERYMRQNGRAGRRETDEVRELRQLSFKGKKAMKKLEKKLEMKISLKASEIAQRIFGREGIAFGISFPKLTERMYRDFHENVDMLGWSEAKADGLAVPEEPPIITLEEGEEEILKTVAVYTARFWPELLDALELRGHLERVREEDR